MSASAVIDIQGMKKNIIDGKADIARIARDFTKDDLFSLLDARTNDTDVVSAAPILAIALLKEDTKMFVTLVNAARGKLDRRQQINLLYDRVFGYDKLLDLVFRKDGNKESKQAAAKWAESLDPLW